MARYIDADKLIAEYDRVHVGPAGGARKLMVDAPTADVVPRSEYDAVVSAVDNSTKEFLKLHDKYQDIKREAENYKSIAEYQQKLSIDRYFEIKQLKQELDKAKGEVAREIFEEIDKVIKEHSQGYCCDWYLYELIAELKKKYTEGGA